MEVLPDIVGTEPRIVFCGMASALSTRLREHDYETPGNNVWEMLHQSGLTDRRLRPEEKLLLPTYGLGLTDLVHTGPKTYDVDALADKAGQYAARGSAGPRSAPGDQRGQPSSRLRRPVRAAAGRGRALCLDSPVGSC